ncbi:MAG: hypothetical protein WA902_17015 [Thermosynechococcaceae cyanobacterium]
MNTYRCFALGREAGSHSEKTGRSQINQPRALRLSVPDGLRVLSGEDAITEGKQTNVSNDPLQIAFEISIGC